jgi:peptidoglycan/LPS O-acetylase OafA/YrhL
MYAVCGSDVYAGRTVLTTESQSRHASGGAYIPELDGLRGVAVLLVVLYHFSIVLADAPGPLRALRTLFTPGWTGVDLFFILSGCLITGILLDEKGSTGYFRRFYIRRVLRICPVYYLALFVSLTVARAWLLPPNGISPLTTLAYLANFSNWLSLENLEIPALNHYWSLAVEEQFYLCWPLAVFFLNRKALLRLLGGVIVLAPVVRFAILSTVADAEVARRIAYVLTPARADGIAFGALVAIILREPRLRAAIVRHSTAAICGIVGVLLAWFGLKGPFHLESAGTISVLPTLLSVGFGLIVLRSASGTFTNDFMQRVLRSAILRKAGRYSFAAYVFHFPLLVATRPLFEGLPIHTRQLVAVPWFMGGVVVTFLLAWVSWSLLEAPILRWKDILAPAPEKQVDVIARAA